MKSSYHFYALFGSFLLSSNWKIRNGRAERNVAGLSEAVGSLDKASNSSEE
jgi:hypothetical protein